MTRCYSFSLCYSLLTGAYAALTITRHDEQFINHLDEQRIGNNATYSCSSPDAQWYYPDGSLVATGPSQGLDRYQFVNGNAVTLVLSNFSTSLQGYYTCNIANPAMSASFGVFVTSNLRECHYKLQATYMHACGKRVTQPTLPVLVLPTIFPLSFPSPSPSPPLPTPPRPCQP